MSVGQLSRRFLRRSLQRGLARSPEAIRRLAVRLPFSRFHRSLGMMRGTEQVRWGRIALEVDPSEAEGYFLYFLGASAACGRWEVDALAAACGTTSALFFDVGTNAGLIALGVAAECPAAEVIAFEPDDGAAEVHTESRD